MTGEPHESGRVWEFLSRPSRTIAPVSWTSST